MNTDKQTISAADAEYAELVASNQLGEPGLAALARLTLEQAQQLIAAGRAGEIEKVHQLLTTDH